MAPRPHAQTVSGQHPVAGTTLLESTAQLVTTVLVVLKLNVELDFGVQLAQVQQQSVQLVTTAQMQQQLSYWYAQQVLIQVLILVAVLTL